MKATHVVPSIANLASGPSWSVPRLCEELAEQALDVSLEVLEAGGRSLDKVDLRAHGRVGIFGSFGVSPSLRRSVTRALREDDVVHNHGLWMAPNIYPGLVKPTSRSAVLIMAPHGTLAPWAWKWNAWKKRPVWYLGQRRALTRADGFHATAPAEVEHIRGRGFSQPVAMVPNGVRVPPKVDSRPRSPKEALFVGRVHPQKGLTMLLRAWARVASDRTDWLLRIVGPDADGHATEVSDLAARLDLGNVCIDGPKFGDEKRSAYERASLFVLPTHTENFGMVVAEALAHGVPTLTTTSAPWEGLETNDCGWWVKPEEDAIAEALTAAMSLPEERRQAMGQMGRRWMKEEFSWSVQGEKMRVFYEWLLGGGEPPSFVHM